MTDISLITSVASERQGVSELRVNISSLICISSSEDYYETKLQAKFDKSDQIFEQPEEELMYYIEKQHQE